MHKQKTTSQLETVSNPQQIQLNLQAVMRLALRLTCLAKLQLLLHQLDYLDRQPHPRLVYSERQPHLQEVSLVSRLQLEVYLDPQQQHQLLVGFLELQQLLQVKLVYLEMLQLLLVVEVYLAQQQLQALGDYLDRLQPLQVMEGYLVLQQPQPVREDYLELHQQQVLEGCLELQQQQALEGYLDQLPPQQVQEVCLDLLLRLQVLEDCLVRQLRLQALDCLVLQLRLQALEDCLGQQAQRLVLVDYLEQHRPRQLLEVCLDLDQELQLVYLVSLRQCLHHLVNLQENHQGQGLVCLVNHPAAPPQSLVVSPLAPQQLQEGLVHSDHLVGQGLVRPRLGQGLDLDRTHCQLQGSEALVKVLLLDKHQGKIWALSRENLSLGFATRVDSNRHAQLMRLARVLKFRL